MTDHLCTATGCTVRGEHHRDCIDVTRCRGCKPAPAEHGCFCTGCSSRLRRWLGEIPELFADVVDPPSADPDARPARKVIRRDATDDGDELGFPRDPVAFHLPAGPVPGATSQPRVSGSRDTVLANRYVEGAGGTVNPTGRPDDQLGDPPPAVLLGSWCCDWADARDMAEKVPYTVEGLAWWLSNRLSWALEHHGAMAEFYGEVGDLHARLWSEAGRGEPKPEHCKAVPCKSCNRLTLYRRSDGSGDVECLTAACTRVYRRSEYDEWAKMITAPVHRDWLTERAEQERAHA